MGWPVRFDQAIVFPAYFTGEMRAVAIQAAAGTAEAQLAMGAMYAEGRGVPRNPAEALHWYLKAANQGLPEAMLRVGRCYAKGQGVDQNMKFAVKWYHNAGAQGSAEAQRILGNMYARGRHLPQDYEKAAAWFRAAARGGDRHAELVFGLMLRDGRGVPKSPIKAYVWLLNAAKSRDPETLDPVLTKALRELEQMLDPEEKLRAEAMMHSILTTDALAETQQAPFEKGAA